MNGEQLLSLLAGAVADAGAPGGVLAVSDGDDVSVVSTGVTNVATGVVMTDDTLCLSGSIQKVFTATLVALLADDGRVDLNEAMFGGYTPRQMLAHTTGLDADAFEPDLGRGDDAVARYVDALGGVARLFEPGAITSYCNGGTVAAGRVAELVTKQTYDVALRERVLEPLGLESAVTLPEDAMLHRTAVGHSGGGAKLRPVDRWTLSRALGPAGGTLALTIGDLAAFGAAHCAGGALDRVAASMAEPQPSADPRCDVRGLGWELFDWSGHRVLSHDGFNGGQCSNLRVAVDRGIVVALSVNFARGPVVAQQVLPAVFASFGIDVAGTPPESGEPVAEPERFGGVYERRGVRFEVDVVDGALQVTQRDERPRPPVMALRPTTTETFLMELPVFGDVVARFLTDDDGAARYFYAQGRAARRVA